MEVAREKAQQGAEEGAVVIADEQTAGRGRIKRTWLSPKGNIAFSVILYPSLARLPFLVMLASLAVVYSIEKVTVLKAGIKWPNDVLINDRKVCGILIESDVRESKVNYAIREGKPPLFFIKKICGYLDASFLLAFFQRNLQGYLI